MFDPKSFVLFQRRLRVSMKMYDCRGGLANRACDLSAIFAKNATLDKELAALVRRSTAMHQVHCVGRH